jgi:hypothetical protein
VALDGRERKGLRDHHDVRGPVPDDRGGVPVRVEVLTVRMHSNAGDEGRKFNRTENVRPTRSARAKICFA